MGRGSACTLCQLSMGATRGAARAQAILAAGYRENFRVSNTRIALGLLTCVPAEHARHCHVHRRTLTLDSPACLSSQTPCCWLQVLVGTACAVLSEEVPSKHTNLDPLPCRIRHLHSRPQLVFHVSSRRLLLLCHTPAGALRQLSARRHRFCVAPFVMPCSPTRCASAGWPGRRSQTFVFLATIQSHIQANDT